MISIVKLKFEILPSSYAFSANKMKVCRTGLWRNLPAVQGATLYLLDFKALITPLSAKIKVVSAET